MGGQVAGLVLRPGSLSAMSVQSKEELSNRASPPGLSSAEMSHRCDSQASGAPRIILYIPETGLCVDGGKGSG